MVESNETKEIVNEREGGTQEIPKMVAETQKLTPKVVIENSGILDVKEPKE